MLYRHKALGLVTVSELAERLGRHANTVYGWQRAGFIPEPSHKVAGGSRLYYTEGEVAKLVEKFNVANKVVRR